MKGDIIIHAKASNNYAKTLCIAFLLSAGVIYVLSLYLPRFVGIVQLLAMALLTAGLVFYTRYLAPKHAYEITEDGDGTPIFSVRQTIGRRMSSLSMIALSDVISVTRLDRSGQKADKAPKDYKRYVYTPTFLPEVVTRLEVISRYEKAYIYIEVSEEFTAFLSEQVESARALRADENEE